MEIAIVKQGPAGVLVAHARIAGVEVPPVPVEVVVNGLGAGDAFGGALVHGLLAGWDARAHGAAGERRRRATSPAQLACADAMPTLAS